MSAVNRGTSLLSGVMRSADSKSDSAPPSPMVGLRKSVSGAIASPSDICRLRSFGVTAILTGKPPAISREANFVTDASHAQAESNQFWHRSFATLVYHSTAAKARPQVCLLNLKM